jgi:hypothetical protein
MLLSGWEIPCLQESLNKGNHRNHYVVKKDTPIDKVVLLPLVLHPSVLFIFGYPKNV